MRKLVLLRHGQSTWNLENRFTGWTDVDLSAAGLVEAQEAGRLLREAGLLPQYAFTSVLKRAIKTLWVGLEVVDRQWIPIKADWHLNERHYGDLQGLNKAETAARFGEAQVLEWRRSYETRPPAMAHEDPRSECQDPRYPMEAARHAMIGESLADTVARVVPYWESTIAPVVASGEQVLVVAHGNSLRALVKHLEQMTPEQIMEENIPTGVPLVYELSDAGQVERRYYLGDADRIAELSQAVANQGRLHS